MISFTDPDANTAAVKRLVRQTAEQGADWVLLLEYWPPMGSNDTDKLAFSEPLVSGRLGETCYARFQTALSETAVECGVVLLGGTVPLQSPDAGEVMNTVLVHGRDGAQTGLYHKVHPFGSSGLGERYAKADIISAGGDMPELSAGEVPLAAGICYDLRFSEFSRVQRPFDVLLLSTAFTYMTGSAYWELLPHARAVENRCYVVAAAQDGEHGNGRHTFGHSMIIDPWGEVLAALSKGEDVVVTDLDGTWLQSVRIRLPTLKHGLLQTILQGRLRDRFPDDFR